MSLSIIVLRYSQIFASPNLMIKTVTDSICLFVSQTHWIVFSVLSNGQLEL